MAFNSIISLFYFCLEDLFIVESGIVKSPITGLELIYISKSNISLITFYETNMLEFVVYMFRIVMSP